MKASVILLFVLSFIACSGLCSASGGLDQVVLLDVQGLWGGADLWISSDSRAVCRFVARPAEGEAGLQESRYAFELSEDQRARLDDLVQRHDFFSIRTESRMGMPDEARPCIYLHAVDKAHAVGKWIGDRHKDFDPLYDHLRQIAESGRSGVPFHKGLYEPAWHPEGFPENKTIRDMTAPAPARP
ncbi:MAG: hypothetical protein KJ726_06890 [Verrucomicrobia bacterium]|nr:hypothetical protein [Verrucomicrobiota bacterium]MBU1909753.1 hypothetical protein [Verrucomicrobiota bacterium]